MISAIPIYKEEGSNGNDSISRASPASNRTAKDVVRFITFLQNSSPRAYKKKPNVDVYTLPSRARVPASRPTQTGMQQITLLYHHLFRISYPTSKLCPCGFCCASPAGKIWWSNPVTLWRRRRRRRPVWLPPASTFCTPGLTEVSSRE